MLSRRLYLEKTAAVDGDFRWLTFPVGVELTGSTAYWIGVQSGTTTGDVSIHYDGSGSDKYWTVTIDDLSDAGTVFAITTSANKYSIRGLYLS